MKYDLSKPEHRQELAERIGKDIDQWAIDNYNDGHRSHLGASLIEEPCLRKLWYQFRWVMEKKFSGRMYRLFNRGHLEELRFIGFLRGIGVEITDQIEYSLYWHPESDCYIVQLASDEHPGDLCEDVSDNQKHIDRAKEEFGIEFKRFKQDKVSAVEGHYGGSMDGISNLLKAYGIEAPLLTEFKTSSTGGTFNKLRSTGVQNAIPKHFAQMSVYGYYKKIEYALYMCVNKNDDDLHVEIVKLDWALAEELERKAEMIITSQEEPPRLHDYESHYDCTYCDFKKICFYDDHIEKNCRSCKQAFPDGNAEWTCNLYGQIPKEFIKKGCQTWESIC